MRSRRNKVTTNQYTEWGAQMRIFILVCSLAFASVISPALAATKPPNIVVIMSDDQADIETLRTMPILRREIAQKGVTFRNSFVDFSLCCPSRSSFITGLAAHNHHVLDNVVELDGGYAKFYSQGWESHTIGLWLQRAGYRTALFGKYLNQYPKAAGVKFTHVPSGWDDWKAFTRGALYYNYDLNENGGIIRYGSATADYSTDLLTRKAEVFIRGQAGSTKPFFLLLTPNAPHTGNETVDGKYHVPTPAPRHKGKFATWPLPAFPSFNEADVSDKPGFVQAVPALTSSAVSNVTADYRLTKETLQSVDNMIGVVVRALSAAGKLDNTIVIFTSDNGLLYGQHRLRGKQVLYEQSIRVPLFIRGPAIPQHEVRTQLVNNLDVVATIIALAGATPDIPIDGKSLLPIISDPATKWRSALLVHGSDMDRTGTFNPYFAVRTQRYVFAIHKSPQWGKEFELYDLQTDPDELQNIAGERRFHHLVAALKAVVKQLKTCSGESCWYTAAISPQVTPSGANSDPAPVHHGGSPTIFPNRESYDAWQGELDNRELE